jgi:hypothetical protein
MVPLVDVLCVTYDAFMQPSKQTAAVHSACGVFISSTVQEVHNQVDTSSGEAWWTVES